MRIKIGNEIKFARVFIKTESGIVESNESFIKTQDGVIKNTDNTYQLADGIWDMTNRELVKFSRSTKAWLDGVEYAPDEPRYNKDGELLVEGQSTNLIPHSASANKDFGDLLGWLCRDTPQPDGIKVSSVYIDANKGDVIEYYTAGDAHRYHTASGGVERLIYSSESRDDFWVSKIANPFNFQRESGTVPTSYIPTTTTAVTRAADIATVRDKS